MNGAFFYLFHVLFLNLDFFLTSCSIYMSHTNQNTSTHIHSSVTRIIFICSFVSAHFAGFYFISYFCVCVVFDLKFRIAQFIPIYIYTYNFLLFSYLFWGQRVICYWLTCCFQLYLTATPLVSVVDSTVLSLSRLWNFYFFFNFVFLAYSDKVLRFVFRALHRIANGMCVVCDIAVKLYYRVNIRLPVNLCLAVCCFIWNWLFFIIHSIFVVVVGVGS